MELNEVIRTIRKSLGFTQEQFAAELGIKRSLIGAYEEGRAEPRLEMLKEMAAMANFTLDDIYSKVKAHQVETAVQPDEIILVPLKAAAGYLRGVGDETHLAGFTTLRLPMMGRGNFRAFEISGDSMLPLLPKSIVVGERIEKLQEIKNGQTYVLVTRQEGIVYKRVYNWISKTGKLVLVSDNDKYKPYSVEPETVQEVWAARAYISKQFPDVEISGPLNF